MVSEMERLDKHRSQVGTRSGPASYADTGGPGRDTFQGSHDGRDSGGGSALRDFPGTPERTARRPNTAPAYYLGHPARLWITVMRPHRRARAPHHALQAVTGGGRTRSRHGGPVTGAGTETACATSTIAPLPAIWQLAWAHHGTDDGPRTPASARDTMWLAWALHDQWPWGGQ